MKNLKLAVLLFFFGQLTLKAQEIVGGFKLSPNYSLVKDDNPSKDFTNKEYPVVGTVGIGLGYFETMKLNDKYDLQAEVNYTMHSFNRKISSKSSEDNNFWTYSYVDLPFIVKRKFGSLSAGLGLMYRKGLSGKDKNEKIDSNTKTITEKDSDPSSEFNFLFDLSYKVKKVHFGFRLFRGNKNLLETGNPANYAAFNIGFDVF